MIRKATGDRWNPISNMNSSSLNMLKARVNADDLQRTAVDRRITHPGAQPRRSCKVERDVTIRLGAPRDGRRLAGLAELDSSRPPAEPVLLAEVDGKLAAA